MNQPQPAYVNHALHLVLCLVTGGLWLFVYIPILVKHSAEMKQRPR